MIKNFPLYIIVLAAGKGTRMRSDLPKVLHELAGKPMLAHAITAAEALEPQQLFVVIGHEAEQIRDAFPLSRIEWVEQEAQLGTGHAVQQVLPLLSKEGRTIVTCGDVPLLRAETLTQLIENTSPKTIGVITADVKNPHGLGRIVRDKKGKFKQIVEEKDANEKEKGISEINSGIYIFPNEILHKFLKKIDNKNNQKEYYLTTLLNIAEKNKINIQTMKIESECEIHGINDRWQLQQAEKIMQQRLAKELTEIGVTIIDANRIDIRGTVIAEQDVTIDVNVILKGEVKIEQGCYIGPNTLLNNVKLGKNVEIKSNCVIEDAVIGDNCVIGPFAHIRPGTVLKEGVKVGNFVEIKKSQLGKDTKANHLSYVGDAEVGENVNIGAGTITCNYDGKNKHKTVIGNNAFIGSNSALVAPVTVGENAIIGAGSVITKDAPADQLTLTRGEQKSLRWNKGK